MKRLIINFGFAVGLVLLINCGQDNSGGGDAVYWNTYAVFDNSGEGLFLSSVNYDADLLKVSIPNANAIHTWRLENDGIHSRFYWNSLGVTPVYIDYGNGDIDTLTKVIKEHSHRSNYPSDIWYYLNDEEVAHFELTSKMINELGLRNNPHNSYWTNDPILIVLPKKPEM
jgi:hypothetical protein